MRKLLRSHFTRLWRDKIFLISAALMVLAGIALPIGHYLENLRTDTVWTLDIGFFSYAVFVPILLSVFSSLFIGTEYSDGTIRNKIVAGHRRGALYLSNLIACACAGLMLCAAFALPYLCVGLPLLGSFPCGVWPVLGNALVICAMTAAFAALYTLVAMLCQSKAYTTAACILLAFLLLIAGAYLNSRLNEPEYYSAYSYTPNGGTALNGGTPSEDMRLNPNYLTGTKRNVCEFLYDFLPGGQVIQLSNKNAKAPGLLALYDLIILTAATGCGMALFKRKDLK